ncbi:MAG: YggT family protein [Actinomycetia bacterium]|nr:YggT family protein [Actinomycetes bacterium]
MLTLLICKWLDLAVWVVLIWVVLSWIPTTAGHPLQSAKDVLNRVMNPMLRPFRNFIPPLRMGTVGVDLSPLALLVTVFILEGIFC